MSEEKNCCLLDMPKYLDLWLVWQILQKLSPSYGLEGFCLSTGISLFMECYKLARPAKGIIDKTIPDKFDEYGNAIYYVSSSFKRTLQGEYLLEELNKMQPKSRTLKFPDDYDLSRLGNLDEWIYLPKHPPLQLQDNLDRQHLDQRPDHEAALAIQVQDKLS